MKQFYYHKLHFIHQSINTPIDLLKLNRVTFSCSVMNILYNELETEQTIYISIFWSRNRCTGGVDIRELR